MEQPVRVFVSYSHADDASRIELIRHLKLLERQGVIESWFDRKILPGERLDEAIRRELDRAELVLFLISADFIASDYCYGVEVERALERHAEGDALVVPIIVRSVDGWQSAPFGELLALPTDGKPVASWADRDEAWTDVVRGLRRLLEDRASSGSGGRPGQKDSRTRQKRLEPDPTHYLETLDSQCSWIKLQGMGAKVAERVALDRVYTRLHVEGQRLSRTAAGKAEASKGLAEAYWPGAVQLSGLDDVLREHRSAVLIGQPGSGKTTFLRFAAQRLARACLEPETADLERHLGIRGSSPFPILVRLNELAEFLADHPEDGLRPEAPEHFLRYLDYRLRGSQHGLPERYLSQRVQDGGCFLLLDGLDEVSASHRSRVAALVDQTVSELQGTNRFLVTCRTRAYEGSACLGSLESFPLADFGPREVESFVRGWCRTLHHVDPETPAGPAAEEAESYRESLQEALDAHPGISHLTWNPLLLTMLAVIHWNHRKLPEQRAELYAVAVDYLLESRAEQSAIPTTLRREALQALALAMFEDQEGLQRSFGLSEAARVVAPVLETEDPDEAREFLERESLQSGLLVSRTEGEVEFWHLTFQEYLAALELASSGDWRNWEDERFFADQWNEVVLLLGGCLRRNHGARGARKLVEAILATAGKSDLPAMARAVGMVGRVLADVWPYGGDPAAGTVYEAYLKKTLSLFEPPEEPGGPVAPEDLRIEVGIALGQAGDPRLADEEALKVEIPGGRFLMGAQTEDPEAEGYDPAASMFEVPPRWVTLGPFRMSKYPVTVGQYERFVDAGDAGYRDPEWWDPDGWSWREREGFHSPGAWSEQIRFPNRPVVRVSWYEARAYSRWVGGDLPTLEHWEYAARGADRRPFPWGADEPTDAHAGFEVSARWDTLPVGIYPLDASPWGLRDLVGNVLEWCQQGGPETNVAEAGGAASAAAEATPLVACGRPINIRAAFESGYFSGPRDPVCRAALLGFRTLWRSS